ncbi:MucBP domain-containing protein [Lacticaseibacillus zhaodongensis]|uniref:MucBP domain-containing protein n=1 Tax=Lacticaseibacillus zhaodongensis TaxID=2668065 RepID=UPI0012D3086C|nr:MucBP domain-containing protein [Lacticaseibacillus zhaodongensis]
MTKNNREFNQSKLIKDSQDRKEHFRMYKAGRQWLVAGVVTLAVGAGGLFTVSQSFAATTGGTEPDQVAGAKNSAPVSGEINTLTSGQVGSTQNQESGSKSSAEGTSENLNRRSQTSSASQQQSDANDDSATDSANSAAPAAVPSSAATTATEGQQTAELRQSSTGLDSAKLAASSAGVNVTTKPTQTQTVDRSNGLAQGLEAAVDSVKDAYADQIDALNTAKTKQDSDNAVYQQAKTAYDNQTVEISSTNDDWTSDQLTNFLAGKTDINSPVTDADREAASDAVKNSTLINMNKSTVHITEPDNPLLTNGNLPSWTYTNVFTDSKTGKSINIRESITAVTLNKDANTDPNATISSSHAPYIEVDSVKEDSKSTDIGFIPHWVDNITARLEYFYADGTPATIDAIVGIGDIDGKQGVKINNGYDSELHGSDIVEGDDGTFTSTFGAGREITDPRGQLWALQKGVTETVYTFYDPTNPDGSTTNSIPVQGIGNVTFATKVPTAPILTTETATVQPIQLSVATNYTIHYQGAGSATPADETKTVIWTGKYDPDSKTITWTPDKTDLTKVSPLIAGYVADTPTAGWTLAGSTADPADQMQTVTYNKVSLPDDDVANLTVHYVDQNGQTIKADTTQSGTQGEAFTVNAPAIDGYRLVDASQQTTTGTYVGAQMTLTLTYLKDGTVPDEATDANLTVHYVDQNGATIKTDTNQSGAQGDAFTVDAPTIPGYRLIDPSQQTTSGKYTGNQMELTLKYLKDGTVPDEATDANLTVHYVDQNGVTIKTDTNQSGAQGETFTIDAPTIPGYRLIDPSQQTTTGKYVGNQMELTLKYLKDGTVPDEVADANLTVHYVDQNGATIKTDTNQSGVQGEVFTVDAPTIPGYRLIDPNQQTITGKYVGNHMELTLHYLKDGAVPDEAMDANLTVHYVDQNGATIKTDTNQSGAQGESFTVDAPTIPGYRLIDSNQQTTTGKYVGNQMDLTLRYLKDGVPADEDGVVLLIVHYVDGDGHALQADTTQTGAQGAAFTVNAPAISGYTLVDSNQQTTTGTFRGNVMELTLVYNQNPTVPDVPVGPNTPVPNGEKPHGPGNDVPETPDVPELPDTFGGDGGNTNTGTDGTRADGTDGTRSPLADTFVATGTKPTRKAVKAVKPAQGVRNPARNLPQTGEQKQNFLSMLGLVLVAAMSGFVFRKHQRD